MPPTLHRLPFLLATGPLLLGFYLFINRRAEGHVAVTMPDGVPFVPAFAFVYLAMLPIPWFLTLFIVDAGRFRRCIAALLLGFVAVCALWIGFPTRMDRPPVPDGWWNELYRRLIAIDRPVNILPCGHILPPVIVMWFLAEENRRWLRLLVPLLVIGAISIVVTWQHRPVDILAGAAIAIGAILVVNTGRRDDPMRTRPGSD